MIRILVVGSIKESFYKEAFAEYKKRLSRYDCIEVAEVKDEKTPDKASDSVNYKILLTEGQRLLEKIKDNDFVVALAIKGRRLDSNSFADNLDKWRSSLRGRLCFVIGGSLGLSEEVLKRADYKLSFSEMTFPHQLMRVILAEQIYRAFRIINNEPYHK
jgi:rRNA large subunit m3Psi methyltransferase rlmH